jgi:hypothetical protein
MGVVRLLPLVLLALAAVAQAAELATFKRDVAGAEVDWSEGTITAQAGAAADLRMPGPNTARPGAERRARAAAEKKLHAALRALGLADDKAALEHATVSRIEYQSNGGVVLWLSVRFSDLVPTRGGPWSFKIATMPFEIAPTVVAEGKEVRVARATYRKAFDCPKDAVPVLRDEKGRLVLPLARKESIDSLAGSAVVIYLEKSQP